AFALKPLEVGRLLADVSPTPAWEVVSGLEINSPAKGRPLTILGYIDVKIDDVPNVWWLRVVRSGDSAWQVERWLEVYEEVEEEVVHRSGESVCRDSGELARRLPALLDGLLSLPPPSLTRRS